MFYFTSCSKKEDSSNIFKYNESQGIENLDPVMASNYPSIWPLNQSMEGLLEFSKDMVITPLITSSYEISKDELVYVFHIRKNVFFHNDDCFPDKKGRAVTSYDFKYCFERVCDPRTKTRGAWLFRDRVKGVTDYINFIQNNPSKGNGASQNEQEKPGDNLKDSSFNKIDYSSLKLKEQWYGNVDMVYAFDLPDGRHGYTRDKNVFHVYNDNTNAYTDYYVNGNVLIISSLKNIRLSLLFIMLLH